MKMQQLYDEAVALINKQQEDARLNFQCSETRAALKSVHFSMDERFWFLSNLLMSPLETALRLGFSKTLETLTAAQEQYNMEGSVHAAAVQEQAIEILLEQQVYIKYAYARALGSRAECAQLAKGMGNYMYEKGIALLEYDHKIGRISSEELGLKKKQFHALAMAWA